MPPGHFEEVPKAMEVLVTIPPEWEHLLSPALWAAYLDACVVRQAVVLQQARDVAHRVVAGPKTFP